MSWVAGVILSLGATLVGAVGKILVKQSHNVKTLEKARFEALRTTDADYPAPGLRATRIPSWCYLVGAVVCMIINPVMDLFSFSLAPQSLLAPMAGATVLWTLLLAPCMVQEIRTKYDVAGGVFVAIGCAVVGAAGPKSEPDWTYQSLIDLYGARFTAFMIALGIWLVLLVVIIKSPERPSGILSPLSKKLAFGTASGSVGGCYFFIKSTVTFFHLGKEPWVHFGTYLIVMGAIGSALGGFMILSQAMKRYDALYITPLYQAFLVIVGAASGAVVFKELDHASAGIVSVYILGVMFICTGVLTLTWGKERLRRAQVGVELEPSSELDDKTADDTNALLSGRHGSQDPGDYIPPAVRSDDEEQA